MEISHYQTIAFNRPTFKPPLSNKPLYVVSVNILTISPSFSSAHVKLHQLTPFRCTPFQSGFLRFRIICYQSCILLIYGAGVVNSAFFPSEVIVMSVSTFQSLNFVYFGILILLVLFQSCIVP